MRSIRGQGRNYFRAPERRPPANATTSQFYARVRHRIIATLAPNSGGAGVATVDDDDFAGDEAVRLDEAHHGLGDVVGGDDALERRALRALAHQVLVFVLQHALHPVAFHPARRDGVDADLRSEVPGERLGEVHHRCLARRVRQRLGPGPQADDARGIDDAALRLL